MKPNKYIHLILFFCLLALNLQAQKTCISGDCINGEGKILKANGDTICSFYKNGEIGNQFLLAGKNHQTYHLISVDITKNYIKKWNDSLQIGYGAIINKHFTYDESKGYYLITRKGDRLFGTQKKLIQFINGKAINAVINLGNGNQNRLEIVSNGRDYIAYYFEQNKPVNGFLFLNASKQIISFDVVDERLVFSSSTENQLFQQAENAIKSFTLYEFDEYYFNKYEQQRTINDVEMYVAKLKNTVLKPVDEFNILVDNALAEFEKLKLQKTTAKQTKSKMVISLTNEQWNDLVKKELIETCKSEFPKEYEAYLFNKSLSDLPTKDDQILYNLSRDVNNTISLLDFYTNGKLNFLAPAFKMTIAYLLKKNNYNVTAIDKKFYDLSTLKNNDYNSLIKYEFKVKL